MQKITINKVIRFLIYSDFVLYSGWELLSPIFAIFIVQNITGGDTLYAIKVAGFSSLTYWMVKSFLQIPIGHYLDKNHGEKDDFRCMIFGTFLIGFVPLGFMFSFQAWHIYFFHVWQAVGMAMIIPSWSAIFTRHIDKGKEAFQWSLRSTSLGIGAGIAGASGGIIAGLYGFNFIFILVSVFTVISTLLLLLIYKDISSKDHAFFRSPYRF